MTSHTFTSASHPGGAMSPLIGYYGPSGEFFCENEGPASPAHLSRLAEHLSPEDITTVETAPGEWVFTDPNGDIVGSATSNPPDDEATR